MYTMNQSFVESNSLKWKREIETGTIIRVFPRDAIYCHNL